MSNETINRSSNEIIHIRPENSDNPNKVVTIALIEETEDAYIGINPLMTEAVTFPKYAWVRCHMVGGVIYDIDWEKNI